MLIQNLLMQDKDTSYRERISTNQCSIIINHYELNLGSLTQASLVTNKHQPTIPISYIKGNNHKQAKKDRLM